MAVELRIIKHCTGPPRQAHQPCDQPINCGASAPAFQHQPAHDRAAPTDRVSICSNTTQRFGPHRRALWPRSALAPGLAPAAGPTAATTTVYHAFDTPGYSLTDAVAKWNNLYGLGEMALKDMRDFSGGNLSIKAPVFQVGYDFSVYDHFSGSYSATGNPYAAVVRQGQQAAAVMNMIDFSTGQLFDWFIAGSTAFSLIERLPSLVTNPALNPGDAGYVGIDRMSTQIINAVQIGTGPHEVSISDSDAGKVSYFLDSALVPQVDNVGVPLDKQGVVGWSGVYPSYGPGEPLAGKIRSLSIGHGLFSLPDAFPFQFPDRPDLAVSIPVSERLIGQGMDPTFDNFTVTAVPEPGSWVLLPGGLVALGAKKGLGRRRGAD